MVRAETTLHVWANVLPRIAFAPASVDIDGFLYFVSNADALREAYPELLGKPRYPDLGGWTELFEAIDLWSDGGDRCRDLVLALIDAATPEARLQLFHLRELWARAHRPELAELIDDSLRPHFDLERGVERDALDALRVLAAVCTRIGGYCMDYTGLAVIVDEASPGDRPDIVFERLIKRADVDDEHGLQIERTNFADGSRRDPPELTAIRLPDTTKLADAVARFFADYVDKGRLTPLQSAFVAEGLRPCIDRLLGEAELYEIQADYGLTCCGSTQYLAALPERWLALQIYRYC